MDITEYFEIYQMFVRNDVYPCGTHLQNYNSLTSKKVNPNKYFWAKKKFSSIKQQLVCV